MKKLLKKKNIFLPFFLTALFFGGFFLFNFKNVLAANIDPAGEAKCFESGGTSFTLGVCYGCGDKGKVTGCGQGSVCQTQEERDLCVASQSPAADAHPEIAGTASQGENLFGREVIPPPKEFKYTLLESFPGFFEAGSVMTDLPTMILAVYKFGIWTIGIAGLFMMTIGGFMYMSSAGNTSTVNTAKGIITDSLIGIAAAMAAYLILYVINPDLTKMDINFAPMNVEFEKIDSSNPSGSTLCQDCESVADICKESPCSLNKNLASKLRTALQGNNARITEGWPATVNHSSSCHGNGTCADVNLTVNKGNVQDVKKLYDSIRAAGLNPVYEDTAAGCAKYTAAGVYCHPYPTMTYPSFHVNM